MKKKIIRLLAVAVLCAAIEFVCFVAPDLWRIHSLGEDANRVLTLEDFERVNWTDREDGAIVSQADPILIFEKQDPMDVKTIRIQADAEGPIPYIDVFYTNSQYQNFGEAYFRCDQVEDNAALVDLDAQVQGLRLDLGDDAGLALRGLTVTVDPIDASFSLSRFIAMMIIYWGCLFLFRLQKAPDYGVQTRQEERPDGA